MRAFANFPKDRIETSSLIKPPLVSIQTLKGLAPKIQIFKPQF